MTAQVGDTLLSAARKPALRTALRQIRTGIRRADRARAARLAARHFLRAHPRPCRVALYLSVRSELSTEILRAALLRAGYRVAAPIILPHDRMRFVAINEHSVLRRGAMRLPEPASRRGLLPARSFDVVLLPLLGFDALGGRLGNGGGYYDRALAGSRIGRKPLRVGYAFAAQECAAIPMEAFDVPLDAVVTERGFRRFPRRPR